MKRETVKELTRDEIRSLRNSELMYDPSLAVADEPVAILNKRELDELCRLALRATDLDRHYFKPLEDDDRFCEVCGNYITDDVHFRAEEDQA